MEVVSALARKRKGERTSKRILLQKLRKAKQSAPRLLSLYQLADWVGDETEDSSPQKKKRRKRRRGVERDR